jgi:hypothetical protein
MGRINLTAEPVKTVTFQAAYNYNAPLKTERGEMGAMQNLMMSVRKTIQNDKGALTFRVVDPFAATRMQIRLVDENLTQLTRRNPRVRSVWVGYQYTFGRPPKVRQGPPAPEETGGGSVGFGGPPPT